ncbi:sulfotransferase family protein [Sagittula salina]|uniref:Sulfotransferase n=1 Tax=Sagittula salina TaxID=2820268 RepID=A0A940S504_9RHOB|nr:sulfotransferase [Sagittula salina]MBP0484460.1 sulfotransferase [Sagittula salina]
MTSVPVLPRAMVVGPMKAGTSWIHEYLAWRGDVCLPAGVKETFYFDRYHRRGDTWYARHFAHFDPARHASVLEVAPSLFHDPGAPERLRASLGPVPLVVTRRDPVARAWSHYQHMRRKGYTTAPLAEAIKRFPGIVAASRYDEMLARWRAALPEAPITVLGLEDLRDDPAGYLGRLCAALELPPRQSPQDLETANAAGVPSSFLLARAGSLAANTLRAMGGYELVNLAKKAGLKDVFFGKPSSAGERLTPSPEERALLEARIGN